MSVVPVYAPTDRMRDDLRDLPPESLARLVRAGEADAPVAGGWRPAELADVLAHQLNVPLRVDLARLGPVALGTPDLWCPPWESRTFGDLLRDPAPPVALLRLVKDFAKAGDQGGAGLPTPIALGLYYAAIAAALLRHGTSISALDDRGLVEGMDWARGADWMAPELRPLFDAARGHLAFRQTR
jgi:hypothetical protein